MAALTRAAHGDPLAVETSGDLPFSKAELDAALSLRAALATPTSARKVRAHVAGDGDSVLIDVTGRQRKVALDGQGGVDAARLVAFGILDLAGDDLDPPQGPTSPPETSDPVMSGITRAVPQAQSQGQRGWSIAAWGVGGTRTEAMLEGAAPLTGHVRMLAAVGGSPSVMDQSVTLQALPARLSVGVELPGTPIELRAGAIAIVERASAVRAETDLRVGVGAAAVWHVRIMRSFSLLLGAGGDGFANAFDYRVNGMPIVTTERLAWWAGAAVAWEPPR